MEAVTLSPEYKVVIPKTIRNRLKLLPGVKFQIISFDDRIEMIPIRPISEMKGYLKGLNPVFNRDGDDRV